jgi:hypothetical protein
LLLVSCFLSGLVGWFGGQSFVCLVCSLHVGLLGCWLVRCLLDWESGGLLGGCVGGVFAAWFVGCLKIGLLVPQLFGSSIVWFVSWLVGSVGWLVGWLVGWCLQGWLVGGCM